MWILVNIGCIECGVSSDVVGVFSDEARAKELAALLDDRMGWREGGQNAFEVFPMPEVNKIAEEYAAAVSTINGTVRKDLVE